MTHPSTAATSLSGGGKDKLCSLVRLPNINLQLGCDFTSRGIKLVDPEGPAFEVAALRAELKEHPDNAPAMLRLANWLGEIGDTNAASQADRDALQLLRPKAEANPHDDALQAEFAEALAANKRAEESLLVLRKAVALEPKGWRCWRALGEQLDNDAIKASSGNNPALSAEKVILQELKEEATRCFDRAIELAPDEAEVYQSRAMHRLLVAINYTDNGTSENGIISHGGFPAGSREDFWRAATLAKTNIFAWDVAALSEYSTAMVLLADQGSPRPGLGDLSEPARKLIINALNQLENLKSNPNTRLAGRALEVCGSLQFLLQDRTDALSNLRQAVRLDASRYQAWEALIALLSEGSDPEELISVCSERVKARDTSRNHLLLAKASFRAHKYERALTEADRAAKQAPDELPPKLALIAIHLGSNKDKENFDEIGEQISSASALMEKLPQNAENFQLIQCYSLNRILFLALSGKVEEARQDVKEWTEQVPNDDWAKAILAALAP